MKKIILILLILINNSFFSQWFPIPSGSSQNINDVYFIDANTGCAVGVTGLIIRSTNGGTNWSNIQSSVTYSLNKIVFKSSSIGYICGDNGYILKTTNAGLNWFIQVTGTTSSFRDIAFIDINTGMAIGAAGLIKSTTNGGTNWIAVTMSSPWGLTGISMNNINRIYVSGTDLPGAAIFLTTDFGTNWTQIYLLSNIGLTTSYSLNEVCFVNNNTGFTVGSSILNNQEFGNIFMTTDGGLNWNGSYTIGPAASSVISDIYFSSASTGTAVGGNGVILRTINGGANWDLQTGSTNHALFSVNFLDDFTGFASGLSGALIKTTDGGNPIGIILISNSLPKSITLYQNYPNPFNPTTKINYQLPITNYVKLSIYDVLGKEIVVLVNEKQNAGIYEVEFDGSNYASGVYFYELITGDFVQTRKMLIIK